MSMNIKPGRILQDTSRGDGLLSIDGQQHVFTLQQHWKSDFVPQIGMVVDAGFNDANNLESLVPVAKANPLLAAAD